MVGSDDALLAISPEVDIQRYDLPEESYAVYHKPSRIEMEVDASFRPLLDLLDGHHSADEVIDRFVETRSYPGVDESLAQFTRKAMRAAARELLQRLCHQGFIESRPAPQLTL